MRLKPGVRIAGIRPEIVLAMRVVEAVHGELGTGLPMTITSCVDGKHGKNSLHFLGCAFDVRTRHITDPMIRLNFRDTVRAALGEDFDVVLEETHLHVEYQPEKGVNQ